MGQNQRNPSEHNGQAFILFKMFISFAPPKEMNQRKGGPKIQPKNFATHRLARTRAQSSLVRTFLGFTTALIIYTTLRYRIKFWISIGLREFPVKAICFLFAAMARNKHYCLSSVLRENPRRRGEL